VTMLREAYPGATITHLQLRLLGNVFGEERVIAGGEVEHETADEVRCRVWLDVEGRGRVVEGSAAIRPNIR
jgi:hypothetical protein